MWNVMCQNPNGEKLPTGEERRGLQAAKTAAEQLAYEMRGHTFYVERNGRVPAVYHYARKSA